MSSESAKEWIDLAKADVKRIQGVYTIVGIFLVVILYTLTSQYLQLRQHRAERIELDQSKQLPWNKLKTIYSIASFDDYLRQQVQPWYQLCLLSDSFLIVLEAKDPSFKNKKTEEEIEQIAAAVRSLSYYNSKLQNLKAQKTGNVAFENLSVDDLNELAEVFNYELNEIEEKKLMDQLEMVRSRGKFILALYGKDWSKIGHQERAAQVLDELGVTTKFVKTLKEGSALEDFSTLREYLIAADFQTFGDAGLTEADATLLATTLRHRKFNSLAALQSDEAQLNKEIDRLEKETSISLPVVGVAIPVGYLGVVGLLFDGAVLSYLLYVLSRLKRSCRLASAQSGALDKDMFKAIFSVLPFATGTRSAFIAPVILVMPGIVSAALFLSRGSIGFRTKAVAILAVVVLVALLVLIVKRTKEMVAFSLDSESGST